jgi:hypothetical protein
MDRRATISVLLVCLAIVLCIQTRAQTEDIAVVVSAKNPVTGLRSTELRQMFAGEKRSWSTGVPVKIFVRGPGAPERVELLKLLGITEREYQQYWKAQVFRGDAQSEPIVLPSNGMQREAVVAYPGAIVLVGVQDIKPGMKVLKVNGRVPGESGYSLH